MKFYIIAAVVSLISVFFKALQNRNYNFDNYVFIIPTSIAIAFCELGLLKLFITQGIDIYYILIVGVFSGLGGIVAMKMHTRFIKKGK